MSIEELERLLYDMYQMDAFLPPLFGKWKEEYENMSYSLWSIEELETYISDRISPSKYGTIDEFCALVNEFAVKMSQYAKFNSNTRHIFRIAENMANAVSELLEAMR